MWFYAKELCGSAMWFPHAVVLGWSNQMHLPGSLPPGPAGIRQFVEGVYANWSNVKARIDDLVGRIS
jgi:hypothetical protein